MPRFSDENFPKNLGLVDKFKAIAEQQKVTPGQVALAWIINENPDYVPIPGTRSVSRLEENARAAEVELSPEIVKEIRATVEAADIRGSAYPEQYTWLLAGDSIPLSEWKGE